MAVEEKKYLVNIEDNLDEYAKRAEDAGMEVEKLTVENLKLKNSSKASAEEIQKSDAALRVARQEYKNAQKQVDLATKANRANAGSYEQLYRQWQLAQTQLKLLGNAYTTNSQGVRVLSDEYIKQKGVVEDAKRSLDEFGKGVADNRLNVGNYSEAVKGAVGSLQSMPGPLGQAAGGVQRLAQAFLALLANPIVLAIAAITAALAALYKAIVSTDKGLTELNVRMQQFRDAIDRGRQRLVDFVEWMNEGANSVKDFTKNFIDSHPVLIKTIKIIGGVINPFVRLVEVGKKLVDVLKDKVTFFDRLNTGARDYTETLDELNDAETNYISQAAKNKLLIAQLEFTAQDRSRSAQERQKALEDAIRIGEEEVAKQKEFADRRLKNEVDHYAQLYNVRAESIIQLLDADDEQAAQLMANDADLADFRNKLNDENYKNLEELYKNSIDLETNFYNEQKRNISKLSSLNIELAKEQEERLKALEENQKSLATGAQAAVDYLTELTKESISGWQKELEDSMKSTDEALRNQIQQTLQEQINLAQGLITDFENQQEILQQQYLGQFEARRLALEQQRNQELAIAEQTGAEKVLIYQKYANAERVIESELQKAKLDLAQGFAGDLATIFGEQTAIGKAAAIAQTLISTYQSAQAAFSSLAAIPVVGPALGAVAAAAAVAAGLANVKKIASVKSGLPGDSGGRATAISASAAAQKAYAAPVGTTTTLTPQLNQAETNALPNQQVLTAEDLINAFSSVPAPVVTVEDINARADSVKKVEVRATV